MALITLLVSSLALAQSQLQDFHLGVLNPDLIYFDDGGQRFPNVLPLNQRIQQNMNDRVGETQATRNGEAIRLPVNMIPQIGQNANLAGMNMIPQIGPIADLPGMNINPLNRPSPNLEPPHYSPNGNEQSPIGNNQQQGVLGTEDRFADVSNEETANVGRPEIPPAPVDKVSLAVSQFGINIMKLAQRQSGNVVVSPYSIGTLLALLQQGSMGVTQRQISNALQMTPNDAADGFKRLTDNLQKRQSQNIFTVGNGVFIADDFSVNPAFKRVAMRDFGSEVSSIKFTRPEQASAKINKWISSKTNNNINKLVTPESVGEGTQLALVNAVYFKGLWEVKFRPEATLLKEFYLPSGGTKMVNFMRMRRYFRTDYDASISSQVLILPFESGQYSLVVILPSESVTVARVMSSLTPEKLISYQNYTPKEVALEVPKFNIKSDTNLVSVFQQLGIINIFGPGSELSGLGNYRDFAPQVSSALHTALLSIDEQGGIAAAATSFGVVALSYDDPSITFQANRPFLAVIWDKQTSVPLFMAKIEDPVQ